MQNILTMIDQSDAASLLVLIGLLAFVGSKMAEHDATLRQWGRRIAAGAFVAYGVLGVAFLPAADVQDWLHVAFRGLLAAGLALGLAWVLLPVGAFTVRSFGSFPRSLFGRKTVAKTSHDTEEHRQQEAMREQAEDRRAHEQHEAARRAVDSRRRDDARMRCLMFYDRHGDVLAERFPRERLQEYFAQYMPDTSPAEIVEERAQTLITLLEQSIEHANSRQTKRFKSLEELADFFQGQREELSRLSYSNEIKDSLITNINSQENEAVRRFLSS